MQINTTQIMIQITSNKYGDGFAHTHISFVLFEKKKNIVLNNTKDTQPYMIHSNKVHREIVLRLRKGGRERKQ